MDPPVRRKQATCRQDVTICAKADKIRSELVSSDDACETAKLLALSFSHGWIY